MRRTAYRQMMWGTLCIMFSFRIQGFDLLPDFVGYLLYILALTTLSSDHESFRTARNLCIPLVLLSFFTIYQAPTPNGNSLSGIQIPLLFVTVLIPWVLSFFMVKHIVDGIKSFSIRNQSQLHEKANSNWRLYIWYQTVTLLVILCAVMSLVLPLLFVLVLIGFILSIVTLVRFMIMYNECAAML